MPRIQVQIRSCPLLKHPDPVGDTSVGPRRSPSSELCWGSDRSGTFREPVSRPRSLYERKLLPGE